MMKLKIYFLEVIISTYLNIQTASIACYQNDDIEEGELDGECCTHGRREKFLENLVVKT
jgi:hypothetical protein